MNLFKQGETALKDGDAFAALESFLTLREQHLDLAQVLGTEARVDKTEFFDVDWNSSRDVVVLARNQGVLAFSPISAFPVARLPFPGGNSFVLYHGGRGEIFLVVGEKQEPDPCRLRVHRIEQERNGELRFPLAAELEIDNVQIHDITYKNNRIYVAASDGQLYQYAGFGHQRLDEELSVDPPVMRLYAGGKSHEGEREEFQENKSLLAITTEGTLKRFTLGPPLQEQALECSVGPLCDLSVADLWNDGTLNIVACTRDGRVIVLDLDTCRIEDEYATFDVFHCVFCVDIDGDGRTEILVGARSGKLYVLGLNENLELHVKWIYQAEHEIWNIQAGNKPLQIILALGDGRIQLYDVYCRDTLARGLNMGIREASQQLSKLPAPELERRFAETGNDVVMEFALDDYARRMKCDEFVKFLCATTEKRLPEDCGAILRKLPGFLDGCHASAEMTVFVRELLGRMADTASDGNSHQKLSDTLNRIASSVASGTEDQLIEFSRDLRDKLTARTDVKINKLSQIKRRIGRDELERADESLQKLARQGLDLLQVYQGTTGIRKLYCLRQENKSVALGQDNALRLFDASGGNIPSPAMRDVPVAYAELPDREYPHRVFAGKNAIEFTDALKPNETSRAYEDEIRCALVIERADGNIQVVGLRNGELLFENLDTGNRHTLELPTFPVALAAHDTRNAIDLYVFTVTGGVFVFQDMGKNRGAWPEPVLIANLPQPANILDVVCLDDDRGRPNLIALCHDRLIILHKGQEWFVEEVSISGGLTCMCPVTLPEETTPQLMIGAAERSLVFYRLNDGPIRKLPLPYIPMALAVADNAQEGIEIFVGFERGDIHRYRIIKERELESLRCQCDEKAQCMERCERRWEESDMYERLASIALATCDECEQGDTRGVLDPKVSALLPHGIPVEAIKNLESREIVVDDVKEDHIVYRFLDPRYKEWITKKQNQFSVVRDNRESLIDDLTLSKFSLINEELESINASEWVFEFLFRDQEKWQRLVNVSRLFNSCCDASQKDSITSAGFSYLDSILRQIPATVSIRKHSDTTPVGMYDVTVPTIRFDGFDRILAFVIPNVTDNTLLTVKKYCAGVERLRLVLVLTREKQEFLADYFRNNAFNLIIFDANDIKDVFLADKPGQEFLNRVIAQVNLPALSPFQIAGPVSDMFYGRKEELTLLLASLERPGWKNYAVVGPRRVGKTSLLHKVRAELQAQKGWNTVYIDASNLGATANPMEGLHAFFRTVLEKFNIPGTPQEFIEAIRTASRARKSRLALFVDEVDDLLLTHARDKEDIFPRTIRTLINEFDIKVVLAGYKSLYFQMKNKESALFNMSDQFNLVALDEGSAKDLITDPLKNVIEISGDTVSAICEKTGRFPSFIQRCCRLLLERSRVQQTRQIIKDDVLEVTKSREFFDDIIGVYVQNLQELTKLVFYLLLSYYDVKTQRFILSSGVPAREHQRSSSLPDQVRFTAYDIHGIIETAGVKLTDNELHAVMDELVLACVLTPAEGRMYKFVLPDLPELMRNHVEIMETTVNMLEQAREDFLHY